ncbi:MAG: TIGR03435 family protein [Candidatus Solibacter sp.]
MSFEVASVRQCRDDTPTALQASPGRLSMICRPLRRMIEDAYEVFAAGTVDPRYPLPYTPIERIPDWVDSTRYSIIAKAEGPQTQPVMRGPMMQALLEDRFHLKIRSETREVPVYLMIVGEAGSKLTVTKPGACKLVDPTDQSQTMSADIPYCIVMPPVRKGSHMVYDVRGISLDVFAKVLRLDLPVIDRTGLKGPFDIHLEWTYEESTFSEPDGRTVSDPSYNNIIMAIRNQLGLRLVRGKGPREFLVIDHIQRPSEN